MLTVLTDNIIDQNHFGNIIRTSHYLTLETVSAQSEMTDFAMKKINTKAIVQGENSNFETILKWSRSVFSFGSSAYIIYIVIIIQYCYLQE